MSSPKILKAAAGGIRSRNWRDYDRAKVNGASGGGSIASDTRCSVNVLANRGVLFGANVALWHKKLFGMAVIQQPQRSRMFL
jgi:hypothetical protein